MNKIHLFLIDNQNDFCSPSGSLYVPGAENDVQKTIALIKRIGHKLDDITCTLDSHYVMHIANPCFWKNSKGERPSPFTQITYQDVESSKWTPSVPALFKHALNYTQQLEKNKRYTLTVWPEHTIIGTNGAALVPELSNSIREWEREYSAIAPMVSKGSHYKTEHYSCLRAEVPIADEPSTQLNIELIKSLQDNTVVIAGQALSHCVANTIYDLADNFGDASFIKKLVLLQDCTSNVPGFEALGEKFIKDMTYRGMQLTTSDKFLV